MKANTVAKHYARLTPEERFKLILAAGSRGDDAEHARLIASAGRISLSMADHAPFANAYSDVAWITFAELLDAAAYYLELFRGSDSWPFDDEEDEDDEDDGECDEVDESDSDLDDVADTPDPSMEETDRREKPAWRRNLETAYAGGFIFKTKVSGWKLFSVQLNLPPFTLFQIMPGFDRIQRALKLTEVASFDSEGMLAWLNTVRPNGKPMLRVEDFTSSESFARSCDNCYRERVKFWCG